MLQTVFYLSSVQWAVGQFILYVDELGVSESSLYTRIFCAIAFKVLTLVTSVILTVYSELDSAAPMATEAFRNFIPESLVDRAEQWNSVAPEPSRILCRFLSVMPPPDQ